MNEITWYMKRINAYGVSRSRDKKGRIVKRELKDYVMCIHASVGGRETMMVLVAEEYEEDTERNEGRSLPDDNGTLPQGRME